MNGPEPLIVQSEGAAVSALVYRADAPVTPATLVLAHGAGAGQRSPFIVSFAQALAARGLRIVTFNFPYTEQHRRIPDRRPVLEACYRSVVEMVSGTDSSAGGCLFIGGKSMGGRIATHIAAADSRLPVSGIVLLGYPLHPPGRPDQRRDDHLKDVKRPMLFVQGSRDTFGTPQELAPALEGLAPKPTLHVVPDGDHSLKARRATHDLQAAVYDDVQRTIVKWVLEVMTASPEMDPRRD